MLAINVYACPRKHDIMNGQHFLTLMVLNLLKLCESAMSYFFFSANMLPHPAVLKSRYQKKRLVSGFVVIGFLYEYQ